MKVNLSSAQFKLNNCFFNAYFDEPLIDFNDKFLMLSGYNPPRYPQREMVDEDLNRFKTWQSDMEEISGLYPISKACQCAYIKKDKYQNTWLQLGGTGFCYLWAINDIY